MVYLYSGSVTSGTHNYTTPTKLTDWRFIIVQGVQIGSRAISTIIPNPSAGTQIYLGANGTQNLYEMVVNVTDTGFTISDRVTVTLTNIIVLR